MGPIEAVFVGLRRFLLGIMLVVALIALLEPLGLFVHRHRRFDFGNHDPNLSGFAVVRTGFGQVRPATVLPPALL